MATSEILLRSRGRTILRTTPLPQHPRRLLRIPFTPCPPRLRQSSTQSDPLHSATPDFFKEKAGHRHGVEKNAGQASTITRTEQATFDRIWREIAAGIDPSPPQGKGKPKSYAVVDPQQILAQFSHDIREQERVDDQDIEESSAPYQEHYSLSKRDKITEHSRADVSSVDGQPAPSRHLPPPSDKYITFTPFKSSLQLPLSEDVVPSPDVSFRRPSFLTEIRHVEVQEAAKLDDIVPPSAQTNAPGHAETTDQAVSPADQYHSVVEVVAKREMDRLAGAFHHVLDSKKATDVGIWHACQHNVFPLMELLDTPEPMTQQLNPEIKASQGTTSGRSEVQKNHKRRKLIPNLPEPPPYIPPLSIVSRIYPAALLLTLRLLAKYTPASPLALALLPTIKSLGPSSYVLGGTAPLYNTLIKLYWDVYSDFKAIDGLLAEMERGGIDWDEETYEILSEIGDERWRDFERPDDGTRPPGSRPKSWWEKALHREGFEKVGVEWKRLIANKLREQGKDSFISEREYRGQTGSSASSGEPGGEVVIL